MGKWSLKVRSNNRTATSIQIDVNTTRMKTTLIKRRLKLHPIYFMLEFESLTLALDSFIWFIFFNNYNIWSMKSIPFILSITFGFVFIFIVFRTILCMSIQCSILEPFDICYFTLCTDRSKQLPILFSFFLLSFLVRQFCFILFARPFPEKNLSSMT